MPNVKASPPLKSTHLRHIALVVDEPDPGTFYWVLKESVGDAVVFDHEVAHSPEGYGTYAQALGAGVAAMREMFANDLENGPRL